MTSMKPQYLYTDGGSRGNPGPAAIAYAIFDSSGNLLKKGARYIGVHTNNEAEYEALLWGMEEAGKIGCRELRTILDSEFVVRQTKGEYKVRDTVLKAYLGEVATAKESFESFEIKHARRDHQGIRLVDGLVNNVLTQKGFPKK